MSEPSDLELLELDLHLGVGCISLGPLRYCMDAIKWGTDYFIKVHHEPYGLFGEVHSLFLQPLTVFILCTKTGHHSHFISQ